MEIINGTYCVYVHTNKINGKMYVGQTVYGDNPKRRWQNGTSYKHCTYLNRTIEKYGWDNFEHEVIASNLTKEEADNFEKILIKQLDTRNPLFGYNLTDGGEGSCGHKLSEEARQKLSEAAKIRASKNRFKKKKLPAKEPCVRTKSIHQYSLDGNFISTWPSIVSASKVLNINAQSIAGCCRYEKKSAGGFMWRPATDFEPGVSIAPYKRCHSGKPMKDVENPMYGKHHTADTKKKMSERHADVSGTKNPKARAVLQFTKDGDFIRRWDYIGQAAQELGIHASHIGSCCRGAKGYSHVGGFKWKFADEMQL